jgi:hypothetical protein
MKLITVANKRTDGLRLWEETARRHGHTQVIVLGLDKYARYNSYGKFGHAAGGNWGVRLLIVQDYMQHLIKENDAEELCVLTDGFDVLVLEGPEPLTRKIEAVRKKPLLFSAELFESPEKGHPYDTRRKWFPYLNAGCYAGKPQDILDALSQFRQLSFSDQRRIDDQRYFTKVLFSRPELIQLDTEAEVFACLNGVSVKDAKPDATTGRVVMRNGNLPSLVHFQGYHKNVLPYANIFYKEYPLLLQYAKSIHKFPHPVFQWIGNFICWIGLRVPVQFDNFILNEFVVGMMILLVVLLLSFQILY